MAIKTEEIILTLQLAKSSYSNDLVYFASEPAGWCGVQRLEYLAELVDPLVLREGKFQRACVVIFNTEHKAIGATI